MREARFAGKVCLMTGGASGIGQAAWEGFGAEGGRVAVLDLNEDQAKQTAATIAAAGGQAMGCGPTCLRPLGCGLHQAGCGCLGRLDVVVNDAAIMTFTPLVDTSEADFDRVLAVNLGPCSCW